MQREKFILGYEFTPSSLLITAVNELDPKEQYQLKLTEYSLPPWLSYFFKGLATFYKYLLEKEHTDFDDIELCLLVRIKVLHQEREYTLAFSSHNLAEALTRRVSRYKEYRDGLQRKLREGAAQLQLEMIKYEEEEEQEVELRQQAQQELWHAERQKQQLCASYRELNLELAAKDLKINKLLLQSQEQKAKSIQCQTKSRNRTDIWITELSRSRSSSMRQLVESQEGMKSLYILERTNLQLQHMCFVEIFPNLQKIILPSNKIQRMEGLGELKALTILDLNTNYIAEIEHLETNVNLKELILHTNYLTSIDRIFHLENLEVLSLSHNKIAAVPAQLASLTRLREARLNYNEIKKMDQVIMNMRKLKIFSLIGNETLFSDRSTSKKIINYLISNNVNVTCANS